LEECSDSSKYPDATYQDVLATISHNLGIDPQRFVTDKTGRPNRILPSTAELIRELVSHTQRVASGSRGRVLIVAGHEPPATRSLSEKDSPCGL
jgi:hypothetical protein